MLPGARSRLFLVTEDTSGSRAQLLAHVFPKVKQVSGDREPGHMAVSGRIWDYDRSVTEVTGDRNGDRDGVSVRP